jgi:hypothetical protein
MIYQEKKFSTKQEVNNTELNVRTVRRSTVYIVKINKLDNGLNSKVIY